MKVAELSDKEVKAILLIQERFADSDNINNSDFIELIQEASFTTHAGKRFIRKLGNRHLAGDNNYSSENTCIFCDWPIKKAGSFICEECNLELNNRYDKAFGSRESSVTNMSADDKSVARNKRRITYIVVVLISVILLTLGVIALNRIGNNRRMAVNSDNFAKHFTELIDQNKWKLSGGERLHDGQLGMTYSIDSIDDNATDCYLIVLMNDPDTIVSASIRIENMHSGKLADYFDLMMMLADTMHEDLTMEEVNIIFSQMLDNGGLIRYGDNVWVYRVESDASTFLITDQSTVNNADTIKEGDLNVVKLEIDEVTAETDAAQAEEAENENNEPSIEDEIIAADLLNYIGKPIEELEAMLGSYEEDESGYYFIDSRVSVIVDEDTGLISYMDVDDIGGQSVTLCGLYIGMPLENIKNHMVKQGINEEPELADDGKLVYVFAFGNGVYELSISLDEDNASLLAINYEGL